MHQAARISMCSLDAISCNALIKSNGADICRVQGNQNSAGGCLNRAENNLTVAVADFWVSGMRTH